MKRLIEIHGSSMLEGPRRAKIWRSRYKRVAESITLNREDGRRLTMLDWSGETAQCEVKLDIQLER